MLLKATTPIELLDNAQVLADKLAIIGADLLIETLYKLERQEKSNPFPRSCRRHLRIFDSKARL